MSRITTAGSGAAAVLGEEDDVSPVEATGVSSVDVQLSESYDEVVFLIDCRNSSGFGGLRFNNVSSPEYRYVSVDGTETTGASEWPTPPLSAVGTLSVKRTESGGNTASFHAQPMDNVGSRPLSGVYAAGFGTPQGAIDSVQFTGGSGDDLFARVVGRTYR